MEQFRQVGESMGSVKALMALRHDIQINQKQCILLYDILALAFDTVSEEIRHNLRLDDRSTMKWKDLELPFKELYRVFKEAEHYIRHCIDGKDWCGKTMTLHMNKDCVELHIHNLLCCFPVVIEAIENAAELSAATQDEMQRRRIVLMQKYDRECDDPAIFLWRLGRQYLVTREIGSRIESAFRDDKRLLVEKLNERMAGITTKNEQSLGEFLVKKLRCEDDSGGRTMVLPNSVMVGAPDYNVRRRLGSGYPSGGGNLKEIRWLGESFAVRTFYGDIGPLEGEISGVLSLSHPNVLQYFCALYDDDRKEGFLVMELMNKDLASYMKENSGKNRIPFTTSFVVNIMLQIARGMEYLHSKKVYHGDLNPSNILLKARNASLGGFQAKVAGFGISSIKSCHTVRNTKPVAPTNVADLEIYLAPEVLSKCQQLDASGECSTKYTEKADVYSFGMLCFELLSGKLPHEDEHLQGEKMARNIRVGERPLFSSPTPKYLANLIRKCWQTEANLRPTFSSICRILRYIKKVLVINPDHGDPYSPPPLVDYCDMEAQYLKKFPGEATASLAPVSQMPFQMFSYKVVEKEMLYGKKWDGESLFDDEHLASMDDLFLEPSDKISVCSEIIDNHYSNVAGDLRSVKSEVAHRRLFLFDRASVGSPSPRRRVSTPIILDKKGMCMEEQRSPGVQLLEKIPEQNRTSNQKQVKVPNNARIVSKVVSEIDACMNQDNNKLATSKSAKVNSESSVIMERKLALRPVADRKLALAKTSDDLETKMGQNVESTKKKVSVSLAASNGNLDGPGMKPVENMKKQLYSNAQSSEKKPVEDTKNKDQKDENSESSETKHVKETKGNNQKQANSEKKPVKDVAMKNTQDMAKNDSPQPSLEKLKTRKPSFSVASSPSRPCRANLEAPKGETISSFARIKKSNLTPSSSRALKLRGTSDAPNGESPSSSPIKFKKALTFSPAASPLRCFNESPAYKKKKLPTGISQPSSPLTTFKTRAEFSPASSPLRTFMTRASSGTPLNNESPMSSLARAKKTMSGFSPAPSPSRCASPKHLLDCHLKELPCTRCSRLSKKVDNCQQ